MTSSTSMLSESTDPVAVAALNALNLDWAQIGAALNLPKNQPIQIRIVSTKIPPPRLPPGILARPRARIQNGGLPHFRPRAPSFEAVKRPIPFHSQTRIESPRVPVCSALPRNLQSLKDLKKEKSEELNEWHPTPNGRKSVDSCASTASTLSQTEFPKSRENSPDSSRTCQILTSHPSYGPPTDNEQPSSRARKWVSQKNGFLPVQKRPPKNNVVFPTYLSQNRGIWNDPGYRYLKRVHSSSLDGYPDSKFLKAGSSTESALIGSKPSVWSSRRTVTEK